MCDDVPWIHYSNLMIILCIGRRSELKFKEKKTQISIEIRKILTVKRIKSNLWKRKLGSKIRSFLFLSG